jgi:hypothetical protein
MSNRALIKMVVLLNNDMDKIFAMNGMKRTEASRAEFDLTMMEEFGEEMAKDIAEKKKALE